MVVRNIKELDTELISVVKPYKHTEEYYVGEVYYNEDLFIVQTPVLAFKAVEENTVELLLDKDTLQTIHKVDTFFIKTLTDKSPEWFESELTIEDTRDIFKSSISFPIDEYNVASLRLKCSDKFKVYDKYNPSLDINSIQYNTPMIALIKLNYLIFYKHHCLAQWECLSLKIKDTPKIQLSKCLLNEDLEDDEEQTDVKVINFNEKHKLF